MTPTEAPSNRRNPTDYDFASDEPCPYCRIPDPTQRAPRGLHWHDHWSRVGPLEYVLIPSFLGLWAGSTFLTRPEDGADWSSPILFDSAMRDALGLENRSGRDRAKTASDVLLVSTFIQPTIIDNLLVTWIGRESPDVAWQMLVINTQAYALTLGLNGAIKRLVGRQRPWGERCAEEGDEFACDGRERYASFYSGHAAITATSAGLLCAHHTQLRLYRDPVLDAASCITGIAATAVTGALRIASDNHWASDVVIGHLMGYASGYLLPTLLYYKKFRLSPEPEDQHDITDQVIVLPMLGPNSVQLTATGWL